MKPKLEPAPTPARALRQLRVVAVANGFLVEVRRDGSNARYVADDPEKAVELVRQALLGKDQSAL